MDPVSIGLAIALSLASNKISDGLKKINLYHCSKKVIDEINESYEDAIKDWSKNQGAKSAKSLEHFKIINNLSNVDNSRTELTNEDKDFLNLFKNALAKRENAWRYLTFEKLELHFNKLIQSLDIQNTKLDNISNDQKNVSLKIDSLQKLLEGHIEIKYDKDDSKTESYFFIPNLKKIFSPINREIKLQAKSGLNYKSQTLGDLIAVENKPFIILKGLPGSGKSFELQKLAYDLWEDDNCDIIPFYRNLRNFTLTDTFESFFDLSRINEFVNVVFILDGLDEIKDENYFLGKLDTFIRNRKNLSHRFVISCRSNILGKHKNDLKDFEVFELQEFNLSQSKKLLEYKTNKTFDLSVIYDFRSKSSFLNDPYKINLVAKYFKKVNKLESNPALLWHNYFEAMLKVDKEKLKKKQLLHLDIEKDSQAIAFILESTKEMNISEDDIYSIIERSERRLEAFINSAMVFFEDGQYAFEHKQLQEYLAALLISSLDYKGIVNVFKVSGIKSIKPSLLNTFTLLISILKNDDPKLEELLLWVSETEKDILFSIDSNRAENFRVPVFQSFFQEKCIETSIWINQSTSVSIEQIGRFADCPKNYDYLMDVIENESMHFRIRTSAIEVLAQFKPRIDKITKDRLFQLLDKHVDEGNENINVGVLDLFIKWKLHRHFHTLIKDAIAVFDDDDDHTANTTKILNLIFNDLDNIKNYQSFIIQEFEYEFDNKKRTNDDNVGRGNSLQLELILLHSKDDKLFLSYFKKLLKSSHLNKSYSNNFLNKCIERLQSINKSSEGHKILVVFFEDWFKSEPIIYSKRDLLFQIIGALNLDVELFKALFKPIHFKINYHASACLFVLCEGKACINVFKEKLLEFEELDNELESFRNIISLYGKRSEAIEIENLLLAKNFKLMKQLKNEKTYEDLKQEYQDVLKKELLLMFDKDALIKLLKTYFNNIGTKEVTAAEIYNDFRDEDTKNSLYDAFGYIKLVERFILEILISTTDKKLTLDEIINRLESDLFYANFVFSEIENLKTDKYVDFKVITIQKKLQTLINSTIKKIKTIDLIKFNDDNSFSFNSYSSMQAIKQIHKFITDDDLVIIVQDSFILETLKYFDFNDYSLDLSRFNKLCNDVKNKETLNKTIIQNLKQKSLKSVNSKQAMFAIKNHLEESYPIIENNLLNQNDIYNHDQLLEAFVEVNGFDILIKLAEKEINTRSCWTAISMLMKLDLEKELCAKKAIEYIEFSKNNSSENIFLENASNVLFELNKPEIINYIFNDLEHRLDLVFKNTMISFSNYTQLPKKGINALKEFFHRIYKTKEKSDYNTAYLNRFFATYLSNLVTEMKMYDDVRELLLTIKQDVEENKDDNKLYHINALIRDIENIYINSLSKGLSFDEALKIVKIID